MDRDVKAHEIRSRIDEIKTELEKEWKYREYAATRDIEHQMSNARSQGLKEEHERLQEILDNL